MLLIRYDHEVDQSIETIREAFEAAETSEECRLILKHATKNNSEMVQEIVTKMISLSKK